MTRILFLAFFIGISGAACAHPITRWEIQLPAGPGSLDLPVSVDLTPVTSVPDSLLSLGELTGGKTTPVPFQLQQNTHRWLHWIVRHTNGNQQPEKHIFELSKAPAPAYGRSGNPAGIIADMGDGALTIRCGSRPLLRYNYRTVYPPPGVDTAYKRSAFIHPLWSPHGQELTRIQPPDHYHHYGIWNPWTHTLFENDTVDFWNLKDRKGTVRFAKFISVSSGPVFAEFEALHEHVVFKKDGTEKVALRERQKWRVWRPDSMADYYIADMESRLSCASESPLLLLAYRYGGLGWRTTALWDSANSMVLTSEGNDRRTADGSKARWCIVQGALNDDYGGAVMLSFPANYNYPEPLRIWPENSNHRGDMFANFDPTKDKDWLLEPGKTYTLKYRLVVFNGKFNKEQAERAWSYFATPPQPTVLPVHPAPTRAAQPRSGPALTRNRSSFRALTVNNVNTSTQQP